MYVTSITAVAANGSSTSYVYKNANIEASNPTALACAILYTFSNVTDSLCSTPKHTNGDGVKRRRCHTRRLCPHRSSANVTTPPGEGDDERDPAQPRRGNAQASRPPPLPSRAPTRLHPRFRRTRDHRAFHHRRRCLHDPPSRSKDSP
ncbi:hypothetical protein BE221DRAFT_65221 [Ostreococcus tauri]|uniref:Uncharacterized protein n=1 Tax=Ostreococcus tauri TaxID=70448 RepID=A0A1Y5IHZ9_OSTTA|nr:hypothetical protein BE221DRAFT_65221 [Ostreococcus tauri]